MTEHNVLHGIFLAGTYIGVFCLGFIAGVAWLAKKVGPA